MPAPGNARNPILRLEDLTVYRGRTVILDRVSWEVAAGEHWVILGPNGSGKTSLLSALTGYLTPSAGGIELLGRRYGQADWPALRRRVGLVSPALRHLLHDDEPPLEIVIGGRYASIDVRDRPRPTDVRQARRWLAVVGCSETWLRPWGVLSQGERQRVLIARALMARPDVLILDEPCAGLDPVAREHFLAFLERLGRASRPVLLLVTHHVEEIVPSFRHALVLRRGRVLAAGPLRTVLSGPILSTAFEVPVGVRRQGARYQLRIGRNTSRSVWNNRSLLD